MHLRIWYMFHNVNVSLNIFLHSYDTVCHPRISWIYGRPIYIRNNTRGSHCFRWLAPVAWQAIIWTNACLHLIRWLGENGETHQYSTISYNIRILKNPPVVNYVTFIATSIATPNTNSMMFYCKRSPLQRSILKSLMYRMDWSITKHSDY